MLVKDFTGAPQMIEAEILAILHDELRLKFEYEYWITEAQQQGFIGFEVKCKETGLVSFRGFHISSIGSFDKTELRHFIRHQVALNGYTQGDIDQLEKCLKIETKTFEEKPRKIFKLWWRNPLKANELQQNEIEKIIEIDPGLPPGLDWIDGQVYLNHCVRERLEFTDESERNDYYRDASHALATVGVVCAGTNVFVFHTKKSGDDAVFIYYCHTVREAYTLRRELDKRAA